MASKTGDSKARNKADKNKADKNKAKARKWKAAARQLKEQLAAAMGAAKGPVVSPLAPAAFPQMPVIAGVEFATAAAGVRYKGRLDVMLARLAPGTTIAGTFTRSRTSSAAVQDCQAKLALNSENGSGAAILVNAGNSNAFTGARGRASVVALCEAVAARLGVPTERVFTSSTGVIGEPLPHERIIDSLDKLHAELAPDGIEQAARAIMTTDTFAKGAVAEITVEGQPVRIAGIAKGSGMVAPDMATMLVYIFTDAKIGQKQLQAMVARLTDRSFNCITVDSDTSTSDTLLVAATGKSPAPALRDMRSAGARAFEKALRAVMTDLAHQVVRDGEGATKFVEITVTGAEDAADAHRCAMAIANSPLVKTAIAGEDPNWGRIVMAVGKSGVRAERDLLSIRFGAVQVATKGMVDPAYQEAEAAAHMKGEEIMIGVDLGLGNGSATVWTCDLTHRYIDINADYRS